jgi:hypothetical protein
LSIVLSDIGECNWLHEIFNGADISRTSDCSNVDAAEEIPVHFVDATHE